MLFFVFHIRRKFHRFLGAGSILLPKLITLLFIFFFIGFVERASAQCPNLIVNGDFSSGSSNWINGYSSSPASGPLNFNGNTLDIAVDNDGNLYPGGILLANTSAFTVTSGKVYFFSVNMNRYNDISTAANFSWVLLNASNAIAMTLGSTYTTGGANAAGAVTIPNSAPVTYSYCFNSALPTGTYRIGLTWQAFENGFSRDIIVDEVILSEFNPKITSLGNINCNATTVQLSVAVCGTANTIVWSGPGIVSGQGTASIVVNAGGHYEVSVKANNTICTGKDTINVPPFATLPPIVLSTTKVDPTCVNGGYGSATVAVTGGLPPYTYSWNTTPVQTSATANGLAAGTYTCYVTDSKGCIDSVIATLVTVGNPLSVSATQTNVLCYGQSNGTATVVVNGGNPPFSYSWNTIPVQTTSAITNLVPGTYNCHITDALGCVGDVSVTLPPVTKLTPVSTQTNVLCFNQNNATANVSVSGGTQPYSYLWNTIPVQNSASLTNLAPGNYTCIITDASGCKDSVSIGIPPVSQLTLTSTQIDVRCFGESTGAANVIAAGGTPPYTYLWNISLPTNSATLNQLPSGAYNCLVKDNNGCNVSIAMNILELNTPMNITSNQVDVSCKGMQNGSATLTVSGGSLPISYSWNVSPLQTSNSLNNVGAGQYMCTIKDSLGCESKKTIVITEPSQLTISLSGNKLICNGNSEVLSALVNGGTVPYVLSWNNGLSPVNAPTINPSVSTNYVVSVTDKNNCALRDSIFITVVDKPRIDFSPSDSGCVSLKVAFVNATQNALTYSWNFGDGSGSADIAPTHFYNLPGLFTVKLIASNQACTDSLEKKNYIHAFPRAEAILLASAANVSEINPEIIFTNQSVYSDLCQINFGDGYTENSCGEVSHIYDSVKTYTVTLIAKTIHGCDDTTSIQVRVYEETTLFVPNAFTPNNDGLNTFFMVKGTNLNSYEMRVFDRWGMEVYRGNDLEKGWDGTYNGNNAQEDVYVYVIKYTDANSKAFTKRGTVTLIR